LVSSRRRAYAPAVTTKLACECGERKPGDTRGSMREKPSAVPDFRPAARRLGFKTAWVQDGLDSRRLGFLPAGLKPQQKNGLQPSIHSNGSNGGQFL
jgi:hypothetical protein